ncbi:hypothetical protein [Salinigranum halophilum]|jgi:hypothetical protein|uniref:hypothetical protein n=1 Tax=Salinigranum halophilum TaxID=2565931 RepID=UPI0010A8D7B8|nr:hypothetical protein [Salinigranum halophilum]
MASRSLPGRDRPYVAAPFLGILVTLPVQLLSGLLGLVPAQTVLVALIAAGLVGAGFGTRYAGETVTAASLSASLAAGGAVIVLIVAGSL